MYFYYQKESHLINHHGDSINPDFAKWVADFVSSFSENLLLTIFAIGLLIFFALYAFILFFSRKR
ncbi:MAG: hypothetical protein CL728_04845 [Chloroflexi bacterium]|nr:hypothetical protein [Chloroflexota bacterium]|tara:strand:- start:15678 stop:15872 length:195 start_codon:yes stop_codon:yes gene_type:complete